MEGNGTEFVYVVEKIVQKRIKKRKTEYRVKWKGWTTRYNTWEPEERILDTQLIRIFERSNASSALKSYPKKKCHSETDRKSKDDDDDYDESHRAHDDKTDLKNKKILIKVEKKERKDCGKVKKKNPSPLSTRTEYESGTKKPTSSKSLTCSPQSLRDVSVCLARMLVKDDTNSCSREDVPHKGVAGIKRKVKVLSKDSEKINVTIATLPGGQPCPKLHCLEISSSAVTPPAKSVALSNETPASHPKCDTLSEIPIVCPQKVDVMLKHQVKTRYVSLAPTGTAKSKNGTKKPRSSKSRTRTPLSSRNISVSLPQMLAEGDRNTCRREDIPLRDKEVAGTKRHADNKTENSINNNVTVDLPTAPPRLWYRSGRAFGQLCITDVTVNLETVTIRESRSERGFFQTRDNLCYSNYPQRWSSLK